jgi:elongation factor Ts
MAEIDAKQVQRLRQVASVGMMDAKKALVETGGDFDKAIELLRIKGLMKVAKRADERVATQGTIGNYVHYQADRAVSGVLVELASETDFVAKNPDFRQTADDIAMHVAWGKPSWIRREEVPKTTIEKERELATLQAKEEGKPDKVIPKIVEGRINAFYGDNVLYDQKFANPEKFDGTVGDLVNSLAARMGETISVRRIVRLAIGEQDD